MSNYVSGELNVYGGAGADGKSLLPLAYQLHTYHLSQVILINIGCYSNSFDLL